MKKLLPFILSTLLLSACSGGDGEEQKEAKKLPPPTIHEQGLRQFTGARTKLVWTQPQNPDKIDKQGTSRHHYLMGIDTADGRGEHRILEEKANYAYPILTPDGEQIVFTRKVKVQKGKLRKFDVTTEIVNFDGTGLRTLGKGYAQEVWEDPETGRLWIYAGDEFVLAGGTAPICERIIRYPLDDPGERETVWDKTQMGTDSFAISADGKRFAGLFPWPAAGIGDLENNDWEKVGNGCWVAMAPDNSYDFWVFDGPHKNLLMYNAAAEQTATIPVNTHPSLEGKEAYHPRWGNHRRFFALTGPHTRGAKKRRGEPVEIFLGKFSPELDRVEGWFQVSKNRLPDIYPDVWIEGASASKSTRADPKTEMATKSTKWPSNPDGLILKWENINAKNEFTAPDGSNQVTKLEPQGFARFGPHYEMVLDGGMFEPILGSAAMLAEPAKSGQPFGFQCLVTSDSDSGKVFTVGAKTLSINDGQLSLYDGLIAAEAFAKILPGVPAHVVVSCDGGGIETYVNGVRSGSYNTDGFGTIDEDRALAVGKDLDGTLGHLAFYDRPITAEEAAADYALIRAKLDARQPIERVELKGKLVAMSDQPGVDDIEPYVRALVYYTYETDQPGLEKIAVGHWAILESKPVPGHPREIGETYDLTLEAKDAHPQLTSQAESMDPEQILLPLYYDVSPLDPNH